MSVVAIDGTATEGLPAQKEHILGGFPIIDVSFTAGGSGLGGEDSPATEAVGPSTTPPDRFRCLHLAA